MSAMKLISSDLMSDIALRIGHIKHHMGGEGADAVIIATATNIYYTTSRVFKGYVYIPRHADPVWFVIKPDIFEKEDSVIAIRKPEDIPAALQSAGLSLPETVGYELDDLSYSEIKRLIALFPDAAVVNGSTILRHSRMVKTPWELGRMREDGIHHSEAYRRVTRCYKENMTDLEFQIEIERIFRLEGHLGFVRTSGNMMDINLGSVIAGDNADFPSPFDFTMGGEGVDPSLPEGANGTTIRPGETVMVDITGSFNGYQTDMTRVWALGEISEQARKAHECSIKILRECEKMGVPGCKVADLYHKAVEIAESENLTQYFMGHCQQAKFIGHGIGIELNELPVVTPRSRDVLKENMTLALEPKFVIPGTGAVGIENTYVVTPTGLSPLTVFPENIQEL